MAFQDNTKKQWKKVVKTERSFYKSSPSGLLWNRAQRWHRAAEEDPYKGAEKNNLQIVLKSKVVDF